MQRNHFTPFSNIFAPQGRENDSREGMQVGHSNLQKVRGAETGHNTNKIEFNYHPVVKRVNIKTKGHAEGVSELLGFEPGEIKGKVESPYIADSNA
ncbi:hypothetical protein TNCV_3156041 [Trichonephila clavipes]|nr:hypothetical protein TNCV_3156041 [Trichonephila clavipes]